MKRFISILSAAVILAVTIIVPSSAEDGLTSAYAYGRLLETAKFTASYFWGVEGFQPEMTIYNEAERLFPDQLQYEMTEHGEVSCYALSEEKLLEVCRSCYPDAPANLFDTDIKNKVLNVMKSFGIEAPAGTYVIPYPGGKGAFVVEPEYVGYWEVYGEYEFYFAKKEVLYLPAEEYREDMPDAVEYNGRVYESVFGEYIALGDLMATGYRITLEMNGTGIYLLAAEQDVDIPYGLMGPPKPDGDVNGDGSVNARDVTALMKAAMGSPDKGSALYNADFNGDGKINARDVTALMKAIIAK